MDDIRLGATLRTLRRHQGLTQADVARRARVSRATVSRLERGEAGSQALDRVRAIAAVVGLRADQRYRWRRGDLDRVMNAGHARMHGGVAGFLAGFAEWEWRPEVTFLVYGERGVIDILAWHRPSRALLVIERKTRLVDPQELTAVMDRRRRLGPRIAAEMGWRASSVSTWVALRESGTNRRRVAQHSRLLRTAFPAPGPTVRSWLRSPIASIDALSFWSDDRSSR